MPFDEDVARELAGMLECPVPPPDGAGDRLFELADGTRLGLRALPGGEGPVAWTEVVRLPDDSGEAEKRAAEFMRLRLARLRGHAGVVASRDESGRLLLYARLSPDPDRDWRDQIKELLNEAEAMRRLMNSGSGRARPAAASLFGIGMAGLFGRP